jgi:hypothetical protein
MRRRGWVIAGVHGALVFGLVWTAACFGTSEDREPQAAVADGGVVEDSATPAVDGPVLDGGTKKPHQQRHSLAVSGRGHHSLHNFTLHDKEGREVVRLKTASGSTDINALQRGAFHVTNAKIEGVELTLYRDDTGKLSLVNALKQQPPTVRHDLMVPPTPKHKNGAWLMEVGPIERGGRCLGRRLHHLPRVPRRALVRPRAVGGGATLQAATGRVALVTVGSVCTASMGVWVSGSRLTGSPQAASPVSCGGDAGCCGLLRAINGGESL